MSAPEEEVTNTAIESLNGNEAKEEDVKQETLFEKTDAISSPPKEMLNDVTIDSLPLDSLTESEVKKEDNPKDENEIQRLNPEVLPTEPLPPIPSKICDSPSSMDIKLNGEGLNPQPDLLHPNQSSPERCPTPGIDAEKMAEKLRVIQDSENLLHAHDAMPNQTIDINIPECQTLKQGWGKVLSYKVDVAIVEDGNTFAKEYCVTRTHDNISSLHSFLLYEYRNNGIIVPPPPPKSIPKAPAFLIEKQKMETNGTDGENKERTGIEDITLKRRCSAITRYLKRLAKHPIICKNKVFLAFLEEKELPNLLKTPMTSTMDNMLESFAILKSRMTYKEIDPWFQTKSAQLEEMDLNLKKLRKCLRLMSDLKVRSNGISTDFRKTTIGLFSGRLFKERDLGHVINQGIECHKLVSAIHQDQASADDLIEQLSVDYLLLVQSAQDILTRRKILQHKVQKQRAFAEKHKDVRAAPSAVDDVLENPDENVEAHGSTSKVFNPGKELEDLEIRFDNMSQVIRKELEHFDFMMMEEFQKEFSAYNSNYFNLIDRSRAETSLSMTRQPTITHTDTP